MDNIEIRDAQINDLDRLFEIEINSFISPYSKEDLLYEISKNPFGHYLVVCLNDYVVGMIDYWITFDNATIAQIAVDKRYRKLGLGKKMLNEMLDDCYAKRVRTVTLEVRTHNMAAINLYKKQGFKETLVKEKYYENGDDALYMIKEVM